MKFPGARYELTSIKSEQILEQKAVDKIDWIRKECSEVAGQLWSKSGDHIRMLSIEHQKLSWIRT